MIEIVYLIIGFVLGLMFFPFVILAIQLLPRKKERGFVEAKAIINKKVKN